MTTGWFSATVTSWSPKPLNWAYLTWSEVLIKKEKRKVKITRIPWNKKQRTKYIHFCLFVCLFLRILSLLLIKFRHNGITFKSAVYHHFQFREVWVFAEITKINSLKIKLLFTITIVFHMNGFTFNWLTYNHMTCRKQTVDLWSRVEGRNFLLRG